MPFLDSNTRKRNLQGAAAVAEVDVAVVVDVAVLMIMEGLRLRIVKVLISTSISLKSTTWYMKSIRSHCPRSILITTKIPEGEEAVVEVEADEVVVVVIIMMRVLPTPDLKLLLSKI